MSHTLEPEMEYKRGQGGTTLSQEQIAQRHGATPHSLCYH